jgi:hypothetical protein
MRQENHRAIGCCLGASLSGSRCGHLIYDIGCFSIVIPAEAGIQLETS